MPRLYPSLRTHVRRSDHSAKRAQLLEQYDLTGHPALQAGANMYLTKPFTPERLAEEAKKLLADG